MSLKRLQKLSLKTRKKIIWVVVIVMGIVLCFFWFKYFVGKWGNFDKGETLNNFEIPSLKEKIQKGLPSLDI